MKQNIINILDVLDSRLWLFVTVIIFLSGLYFFIKLKGIQFNLPRMLKNLFSEDKVKGGISSFKTLMLSLAGRIGVGSISGVALAIYLGGPGTILWIWVIAIISAPLAYCETFLGVKYKEKDENKISKGGPAYYIKKGLNNYDLGALYSIIMILCYVVGFMSVQSNTITKAVTNIIDIRVSIVGILISILTALIIFGGIKKISNTTSKIVPIMSGIYILIAIIIVAINIKLVPNIFISIVDSAFNFKSFISGFIPTMLIGVQRGIFSNEAGLGTGSVAASSGESKNPIKQGYIQMIGIYITSLFICTSTAIIILTSNYEFLNINDPNGIEIATFAFTSHLGGFGNIILSISIFLFAFSTILSGYYYGESSLKYFFKKIKKEYLLYLKLLTILVIFIGSISSPTILWKITDIFVAILSIINIYAIIKLRKEIKK